MQHHTIYSVDIVVKSIYPARFKKPERIAFYQFMTASPRPKNQYGLNPIREIKAKPNLKIISSQGQLQVYSSPYRGSFSSVLSEALRSAGLGSKVLISQFLKGGVAQGPNNKINLCGGLEWLRPNIYGCINLPLSPSFKTSEEAQNIKTAIREIWEVCKELIYNNSLDKLILDEIGLAIECGFIKEKELINALENRHESIDVIFTGPSIPSKVFAMADQITQLRCSK